MNDDDQFDFGFDAEPEPEPEPKPPLIDPVETRRRAEEGMKRARLLISEARRIEYMNEIYVVAKQIEILKVDQIWNSYGGVGDIWKGGRDDGSAMGPCLIEACKLGWLKQIDIQPSERPVTRGKPVSQWRSLIYDPGFVPPAREQMVKLPPGILPNKQRPCEKCAKPEWMHYACWANSVGADHPFEERQKKTRRKDATLG